MPLYDIVALVKPIKPWPAGTSGTVVDEYTEGITVELVGPDGSTLDLLDLPLDAVELVQDARQVAHV